MLEAPKIPVLCSDGHPAAYAIGEYLLLRQIRDNRLLVLGVSGGYRGTASGGFRVVGRCRPADRFIDKLRAQASWLVSRLHGNLVQFLDVGQAARPVLHRELIEADLATVG